MTEWRDQVDMMTTVRILLTNERCRRLSDARFHTLCVRLQLLAGVVSATDFQLHLCVSIDLAYRLSEHHRYIRCRNYF